MPAGLVNASGALSDISFLQSFSYTNETGSYDSDTGEWVGAVSAPIDSFGSVQPLGLEERQEMISWVAGGARILSSILIITQADLIAAENGDPTSSVGSTVLYDGLLWKVIMIEDFSPHGHIEAIAVRIDDQIKA